MDVGREAVSAFREFLSRISREEEKTGIDLFLLGKGSAPGVFWDVNLDFVLQLWEMLLPWPSAFSGYVVNEAGESGVLEGKANQLLSSWIFDCETFPKVTNSPERLRWTFLYDYI